MSKNMNFKLETGTAFRRSDHLNIFLWGSECRTRSDFGWLNDVPNSNGYILEWFLVKWQPSCSKHSKSEQKRLDIEWFSIIMVGTRAKPKL